MSSFIVRGPLSVNTKQGSLGKILYDNIKSKNENTVFMVDAVTGEELNYKKTLEWSVKLAVNLKKLGVRKNDVLAIVSENMLKYIIPVTSALYLGAAINCVNPNYTENELHHCFSITKPKIILSSENCLEKIFHLKKTAPYIENIIVMNGEHYEHQVINLNTLLENDKMLENFICEEINPKDTTGLILYSSGTTGLPKGVMLSHCNLSETLLGYMQDINCMNWDKSITLGFLPIYHIFGIMLSMSVLLTGSKIIILNKFQPEVFLKMIQDFKVNTLFIVPPILLLLAKSPLVDNYNLNSLEDLICGGDSTAEDLVIAVEKRLKNAVVRQAYGLTENCGAITFITKSEKKHGSVGTVLPGQEVKVVDTQSGKSLGSNKSGEICVKSDCVMMGYIGNVEESKVAIDSEGYLRTGDIGYYDEDGFFYIVGRIKELIKFKGFQVSPAELEELLIKHYGVKDVAVVGKVDDRAGELPTAFVVKQPNENVTEKILVDYVAENISNEKRLRGGVVFVDEIPKNASGKILRKLLREMLSRK